MTKLKSFSESVSTGTRSTGSRSNPAVFDARWDTIRVHGGTRFMKELAGKGYSQTEIKKRLAERGWVPRIISMIFKQADIEKETKAAKATKLTARATKRKSIVADLKKRGLSSKDIKDLLAPYQPDVSRPAVVSRLMRSKKLSPKMIGNLRTARKKYGPFKPTEIKEFLIGLGVPELELWQQRRNPSVPCSPSVPCGNNYHSSVGWY